MRQTKRYRWAWRHLDLSMRLALFFAHRLPMSHADRNALSQGIRKIVRKQEREIGT